MKLFKTVLVCWLSLIFSSAGWLGFDRCVVADDHHSVLIEDGNTTDHFFSHSHGDHSDHGINFHEVEACCATHEHIPCSDTGIPECTVSQANVIKIFKSRVVSFSGAIYPVSPKHFSALAYAVYCPLLGTATRPDGTVVLRI